MGNLAVVKKSVEKPWVDRTIVTLNTERLVNNLRENLKRIVVGECQTMSDVGKKAAKKLDSTAVEILSSIGEILDVIEKLAGVNRDLLEAQQKLREEKISLEQRLSAALRGKEQEHD